MTITTPEQENHIKEIWKDVVGFENLYEVSNQGEVRTKERTYIDSLNRKILRSSKIMKQTPFGRLTTNQYRQVRLTGDKEHPVKRAYAVHQLVANAFIPNPNNYPIINHKDGVKCNNSILNLEWCTYSYNNQHAYNDNLKNDNLQIIQVLQDGTLVGFYNSLRSAARITGFNRNYISKSSQTQSLYQGFYWLQIKHCIKNKFKILTNELSNTERGESGFGSSGSK